MNVLAKIMFSKKKNHIVSLYHSTQYSLPLAHRFNNFDILIFKLDQVFLVSTVTSLELDMSVMKPFCDDIGEFLLNLIQMNSETFISFSLLLNETKFFCC